MSKSEPVRDLVDRLDDPGVVKLGDYDVQEARPSDPGDDELRTTLAQVFAENHGVTGDGSLGVFWTEHGVLAFRVDR